MLMPARCGGNLRGAETIAPTALVETWNLVNVLIWVSTNASVPVCLAIMDSTAQAASIVTS